MHFFLKIYVKGMKIIVFSKWFQGINEISYQKKWLPRLNAQVCVSSAFYQHNLGFECYGDINEKTEAKGVDRKSVV